MYWNRNHISLATLLLLLASASGFTSTSSIRLKSSISQNKAYHPSLLVRSQRSDNDHITSRRQKIWRTSKKALASLTLAFSLVRNPPAAEAKPRPVIQSIKPGLTGAELEAAMDPDVYIYEETGKIIATPEDRQANSAPQKKEKSKAKPKAKSKAKPKAKSLYEDDDEDDDDDDIDFEDLGPRKRVAEAEASEKAASGGNVNNLGIVHHKEYSAFAFMKAMSVFAAIPVAFFFSIETYRRTHEKSYVKKALKIQAMKKKEYEQKVKEERLAEMKANETSTDEDEEEEEEEEDVEDDEDDGPSPKPPKTPPPSGGDNGGESGPSADDIDRLNKLMGRS